MDFQISTAVGRITVATSAFLTLLSTGNTKGKRPEKEGATMKVYIKGPYYEYGVASPGGYSFDYERWEIVVEISPVDEKIEMIVQRGKGSAATDLEPVMVYRTEKLEGWVESHERKDIRDSDLWGIVNSALHYIKARNELSLAAGKLILG